MGEGSSEEQWGAVSEQTPGSYSFLTGQGCHEGIKYLKADLTLDCVLKRFAKSKPRSLIKDCGGCNLITSTRKNTSRLSSVRRREGLVVSAACGPPAEGSLFISEGERPAYERTDAIKFRQTRTYLPTADPIWCLHYVSWSANEGSSARSSQYMPTAVRKSVGMSQGQGRSDEFVSNSAFSNTSCYCQFSPVRYFIAGAVQTVAVYRRVIGVRSALRQKPRFV